MRRRCAAQEPVELPTGGLDPLSREWAVVCEAVGHAACLAGVELPPERRPRDSARTFEVIWSVEPSVVRAARVICAGLAAVAAPELAARLADRADAPLPPGDEQLRLAAAITSRTLERLG